MKNRYKLFLACITLFLVFSSFFKLEAQVTCGSTSFYIENNTNCKALVNITFYSNGSICGTQSGVWIGPISTFYPTWPSGCTTNCDVAVELVSDGTFSFGGAAYNVGGGSTGFATTVSIAVDSGGNVNTCLQPPPHFNTMDWMGDLV